MVMLVLAGCATVAAAADNERYSATAAIEAQDPTFQSVLGGDYQNNPAAYGDPPAPGGISASYARSGSSADGTFSGSAHGAVDPDGVPPGAAPILRADATGSVDLTSVDKMIFGYRVSGSSAWEFDLAATGPGGTVYMSPIFNIDGTLTGSGAALEGGAKLNVNVIGGSFMPLVSFPVPTDGSTTVINTATPALPIPLASGATEHIVFSLEVTLDLIGFAGATTPYSASATGNFSSSAQLVGLRFFADKAGTMDISRDVTVTGGGGANLQSLVVPEPVAGVLLVGGVVGLIGRRRAVA